MLAIVQIGRGGWRLAAGGRSGKRAGEMPLATAGMAGARLRPGASVRWQRFSRGVQAGGEQDQSAWSKRAGSD